MKDTWAQCESPLTHGRRGCAGHPPADTLPPPGQQESARDIREGCESGRIGTLGKRVWGNPPWVRIPLPPPQRHSDTNWTQVPGRSLVSEYADACRLKGG